MISIDSDCIIDFLRGKEAAINIVEKYKNELVTTEINIFEIFNGLFLNKNKKDDEEQKTNDFFESLDILDSTGFGLKGAAIFSSLIKNGNEIDQNDCLIAAVLLNNGCDKIITRNVKDFSKIKNLKIISY
ncbi:MAG: type II toxin-antitoxin system VapC family toxin [Nanoarchaeota archaeon]